MTTSNNELLNQVIEQLKEEDDNVIIQSYNDFADENHWERIYDKDDNKPAQVKPSLAKVLSQPKQIILSILRDNELSYLNDNNSNDWDNKYLATITSQYSYNGAYIAFDCECLVEVLDCGKVVIEQYDTSPDAYAIHCEGIGNIEDISGYFYEIDNYDDFGVLELEHEYSIVTDKPDFMIVEWY